MLVIYFVPPLSLPDRRHSRIIHSSSNIVSSPSDYAADAAALFFSPSKSRPTCSHHRQYTLIPGLRADCSQRYRIGRVAIYCATVFCLIVMYFLIPSKPASTSASSNDGYSQISPPPSPRLTNAEPPCNPVLETNKGPLHPGGSYPRLRPKKQHLLCHRLKKMS